MLSPKYFPGFGPILHLTLRIWFDVLQVCWVKKEAQIYCSLYIDLRNYNTSQDLNTRTNSASC